MWSFHEVMSTTNDLTLKFSALYSVWFFQDVVSNTHDVTLKFSALEQRPCVSISVYPALEISSRRRSPKLFRGWCPPTERVAGSVVGILNERKNRRWQQQQKQRTTGSTSQKLEKRVEYSKSEPKSFKEPKAHRNVSHGRRCSKRQTLIQVDGRVQKCFRSIYDPRREI